MKRNLNNFIEFWGKRGGGEESSNVYIHGNGDRAFHTMFFTFCIERHTRRWQQGVEIEREFTFAASCSLYMYQVRGCCARKEDEEKRRDSKKRTTLKGMN